MRLAISLPDRVVRQVERQARRTGKTRSRLLEDAVTEYMARHKTAPTRNGKSQGARKSREAGVKARFTRTELLEMARQSPPPESWFEQPAADLTKPA
jgi:metal-responsive CopG/Arc/MetJ family transcriptional regulator